MYLNLGKVNGEPHLRVMQGYTIEVDGKAVSRSSQIANFGKLSQFDDGKPDFPQRLRESFKNGKPLVSKLEQYIEKKINQPTYLKLKNLSNFILEPYFENLGIGDVLRQAKSKSKIDYDLPGILKLLTFGRILNPDSKLSTFEQNDHYLNPCAKNLKLKQIYRALDKFDELSNQIQTRMNTKISQGKIGRNTSHVFYDVTNYYYETQFNDEDETMEIDGERVVIKYGHRKRGVSKENKQQPLTQMGLFIDDNGIPISYKIFPGNKTDQTTFRPALRETIDNYNLGRVIVVADRGLNNDMNIAHLIQKGNGYVISKSMKKNKSEVREWIKNQKGYRSDSKIVEPGDDVNFKVKSRTVTRKIKDENGKLIEIKEKQVVYWSKAHYLREAKQNKAFMKYLDSAIEFPDKIKDKQAKIEHYLKTTMVDKKTGEVLKVKKVKEVDEKKVQEFIDLMGYYLITTSEVNKTNGQIISVYHGLSRIEDSFRITKSDLEGRPVYVRKVEHINAHFLICFIALTIIRLLQYRVLEAQDEKAKVKLQKSEGDKWWTSGITADALKGGLNSWIISASSVCEYKMNEPTDVLNMLSKALGIDLSPVSVNPEVINVLKMQLQNRLSI